MPITYPRSPEPRWHHSPVHWFHHPGIYMITAGIYRKQHLLATPEKRDRLLELMFETLEKHALDPEAWAILNNHYHLVVRSSDAPEMLRTFIQEFHSRSAKFLNQLDRTPGRRVWFQYWDTRLARRDTYLARLAYVHANAVHHGLATRAEDYPWCSASWFVRTAPRAFVDEVVRFRMDGVQGYDVF